MTFNALNYTEDLAWFSLDNYNLLTELTLEEFFNELSFRLDLFEEVYDEEYEYNIFPNSNEWQNILKGNVIVKAKIVHSTECKCSHNTYGIAAVTHQDLHNYATAIDLSDEHRDQYGLNKSNKDPYMPLRCNVCEDASINFIGSDIIMDDLILKVDLHYKTDKEIHAGLALILDEYRQKLKISEPKVKVTGITKDYFKTAVNKSLIPYIDLRLWAIYHKSLGKSLVFEDVEGKEFIPSFLVDFSDSEVKKAPIASTRKLLFPNQTPYDEKSDKYITSELPELLNRYLDNAHYRKVKYYLHKEVGNRSIKIKELLINKSK